MQGILVAILLCAFISIAVIAMHVLLGVWVYRDAKDKGMNGVLWTAVAILVPSYIGLIIYLIIRVENKKVTCSNCAASVNGKSQFCSNCGMELVPTVEVKDDTAFRKSQKRLIVGFISSLVAVVIMVIFLIAAIIMGTVSLVGTAIEWASNFDSVAWVDTMEDTLEDTLGDIDVLFNEEAVRFSVGDEQVKVTDKEGNELIKVDGVNETVDVNLEEIQDLLEEYGVNYNRELSEQELETVITQEVEEAIADALEESLDNSRD